MQQKHITMLLALLACAASLVQATAVAPDNLSNSVAAHIDSPALRIISDEDKATMQHIRRQIDEDFANFKKINEVHAFLDKVKLLVQKHSKNVAFAQGDLKDLQRFLSQEIVTRLIRVDTDPFVMPITDERMPLAQRAIEDDELTGKLFGGPLRSLIEAKRQQVAGQDGGNHRDGNFFSNLWCKISNSCAN